MPRKKSEFENLTSKRIVKTNPERKRLFGEKKNFVDLLSIALKVEG